MIRRWYLIARYPWTQSSSNHLYASASMLPPIINTISVSSLKSGSQPMLPPGELSNMNPKSDKPSHQHGEKLQFMLVNKHCRERKTISSLFDINVGSGADSSLQTLDSQPAGDMIMNPAVGCTSFYRHQIINTVHQHRFILVGDTRNVYEQLAWSCYQSAIRTVANLSTASLISSSLQHQATQYCVNILFKGTLSLGCISETHLIPQPTL